ncbi:hypothetical protein [Staphylococcus sp. JADD-173]|uniref:hypothetical protein n=1 Tax=Staphylococcus sp. JADD-173 TaxID=3404820 RepID=UPI003BB65457
MKSILEESEKVFEYIEKFLSLKEIKEFIKYLEARVNEKIQDKDKEIIGIIMNHLRGEEFKNLIEYIEFFK